VSRLLPSQKPQARRNIDQIEKLTAGAECDIEESQRLTLALSRAALDDIACDRDRGPPDLRLKAEAL
jgi:hypothetical protein